MFLARYKESLLCIHNRWRCSDTACRKSAGLRDGTFFSKSNLTLQQWMVLMYWWAREYPVTDAAQEAKVEKNTAIQAYEYFRDILGAAPES